VATRVLLEHVRHVCPPELEIELLVLAPEEIVALADVEGEEGGVVLALNGQKPPISEVGVRTSNFGCPRLPRKIGLWS